MQSESGTYPPFSKLKLGAILLWLYLLFMHMAPDFFHSHSSSIRSDHNWDMDKSSHDKSSWKKADQSSFCMCHAANPEAFMIHDPGPDAHDCLWPSPQTLELLPRSSMCYMWWNICCSSSHVHPMCHAANPEAFMIHDPGPDAHDCLWPSPQPLELLPRSSMCYM